MPGRPGKVVYADGSGTMFGSWVDIHSPCLHNSGEFSPADGRSMHEPHSDAERDALAPLRIHFISRAFIRGTLRALW
jgi:hypothetical protein